MSALSHQSFANSCNAFWLKAGEPVNVQTPLNVVDNITAPTKSVQIAAAGNTGSVRFSGYPLVVNPVSMNLNQGATQPLNTITFNIGNVNPILTLTTSNVQTSKALLVADPLCNTSMLIDSATGVISNSIGTMTLQNFFVLNSGFPGTVLSATSNSNIQTASNLAFYTSGNIIGGMAISGSAILLGTTSNFPTSYAMLLDNNNIVQIKNSLRVLDSTNSGNFINFYEFGNNGYLEVWSGGVGFPKMTFSPDSNIYFGSNRLVLGPSNVNSYLTANSLYMQTPGIQVGQYLNIGTGQEVFYTSNIGSNNFDAMIIETNGVVTFPQGANLCNANLSVSSITTPSNSSNSIGGVYLYSNGYIGTTTGVLNTSSTHIIPKLTQSGITYSLSSSTSGFSNISISNIPSCAFLIVDFHIKCVNGYACNFFSPNNAVFTTTLGFSQTYNMFQFRVEGATWQNEDFYGRLTLINNADWTGSTCDISMDSSYLSGGNSIGTFNIGIFSVF